MAYLGLPLDLFGKVSAKLLMKNAMHDLPNFTGCFLPTIPSLTAIGYDQREQKLVVWDHEFDRSATERDRPLCRCESTINRMTTPVA